ncbi:unnamed protein product [Periconia digitata]|uniref:Uncharacterized protein n=1 Tax=Periconia digitata TaxID=1303443 RepID=A0A9W4U374_9PLEO|nr:unnamed protein product [Periconia digitata]
MFNFNTALAVASLTALTGAAPNYVPANNTEIPTIFKPATLIPFLHMEQLTSFPTNVTTIEGITARYPNLGGTVSGALEGSIVDIGSAYELLPTAGEGVYSFYTNTFTINTTDALLHMDARATIQYGNNALHGFGTVTFSTDSPKYLSLNWGSYVAEFEANFNSGTGSIDVFELKYTGKKDGTETPALVKPEEA